MILGVYGASGWGKEVLELAKVVNNKEHRWEDFIFIDDGDVPLAVSGYKVYKYEEAKATMRGNLQVVVGIGEPAIREIIFNKLLADGIEAPTLIHPDVYIPESTKIGKGVVIQYGCFVSCNVIIGDYVVLQPQCNIGHDVVVDEGCMISGFGNLSGAVHVGKWTYVGMSAAIMQTLSVGDYSIISMGAIVQKDVESNVIVMGNPARPIAKNEDRRVFRHK